MIIKQYENGIEQKSLLDIKDVPDTWINDVNTAFDHPLSDKYCIQAACSGTSYEFYIIGGSSKAVPISGTKYQSVYKKGFDTNTMKTWEEVYYIGYAFNVDNSLIVTSKDIHVLTSFRYEDGVDTRRSVYFLRNPHSTDVPEDYFTIASVLGLQEYASTHQAIKIDIDENDNVTRYNTYKWENI